MNKIKKSYLKVSLLIAVHYEISVSQLKISIESIFLQKSIPNQIIIIIDGPISNELSKYISEIKIKYIQILILNLKINKGLANALNKGIEYSSNELIARLDPDDILINDRFFHQKEEFDLQSNLTICGSYIHEIFNEKTRLIKKPLTDFKIKNSLKIRNPIVHSTVMFKKSKIIEVGGYPIISKCQDYLLWVKCMEKSFIFKNINKSLVITKLNKRLMVRRNIGYFYFEKKIYGYMYKKKLIGICNYLFNITSRYVLRLMPVSIKILLYQIR